jgi:Mg2+ and Co2+ transporter CorA
MFLTNVDIWAYFETKQTRADLKYDWIKLNIFTRWVPSTNQTFLLLFDPIMPIRKSFLQTLSKLTLSGLSIPFWPYSHVLEIVADLQESAVWAIRNQVRAIEKEGIPGTIPRPDYRRLHDIARHAIHVSESLDVSIQNIESILKHYNRYISTERSDSYFGADEDIHNRIESLRSYIANLRHRSTSNEKRLQNEIQLAFNTVAQANATTSVEIGRAAQANAATSVEIGRAAQIDSSAMKTISFVTLAFLPPTFISSIFSMSFFQCGEDNGWGMSNKFWLYWVFAIPTTIATVVIWQYWHKLLPGLHHNEPVIVPVLKENA